MKWKTKKIKIQLYKQTFLFFILVLVTQVLYSQETSITGLVVDKETQKGIPGASVLLYENDTYLSYAYTDDVGNYHIILPDHKIDTLIVNINSFGYASVEYTQNVVKGSRHQVDFELAPKFEELKAVLLKPEEKIKVNRDTIAFRLSAFKDGSERSVEDMLKKLPGIEVSEKGNITALGKPIDKILIEGDDLANKNYKVLSKNLGVDYLEKIEIISNFDENPILKEFLNSERVVLNLKLKNSKKAILFGKVEAGGGMQDRYISDLDLGFISPGIKFLDLANINNVGEFSKNQFQNYTYYAPGFNNFDKNFGVKQQPIIYLQGRGLELKEKNYIQNKSISNNFLINKRYSDSLTVRNSLFLYQDKLQKTYFSDYLYLIESQNVNFKEENKFNLKYSNLINDLEISYAPSEKTSLSFKNNFLISGEKHNNDLKLGENDISQNLKNAILEFDAQVQWTQKLRNGVSIVNLFFGRKDFNQVYDIVPNTFDFDTNSTLKVNYDTSINTQGIDASLIYKKNNLKYSFSGGLSFEEEKIDVLSNEATANETITIDSLSGNNFAKNLAPYSEIKLEYEPIKNIVITSNAAISLNIYEKNSLSKNIYLPEAGLTVGYMKTKTGSYSLGYTFKSELPRLRYFTDNYLVKSYRGLTLGSENVEALKRNSYFFRYNFSNIEKRILLNASLIYTVFDNQFSTESILNPSVDISRFVYSPGQRLLLMQAGFTTYFNPLHTSVKFGYQYQSSVNNIQINNVDTQLSNLNSTYYISGTTYFRGVLNFRAFVSYTFNKSGTTAQKVNNDRFKFELNTILKFNPSFVVNLQSNFYTISSQFYETNNIQLQYEPKGKDWSLGAQVHNIFDRDVFIFDNATDFVQTSNVFVAVPRYMVLSGKLRF